MSDPGKAHWEGVYRRKGVAEVSWYAPRLDRSLELIGHAGLSRSDPIIDVGGGASTLVDHLLEAGYWRLWVLDLSATALGRAQARLGGLASRVHWLEGDVTTLQLQEPMALWHDRAVFHFLTRAEERAAYLERLAATLKPGGQLVMATFSPEGPAQCSGLPVVRYSPESLAHTLGEAFQLLEDEEECHVTPSGNEQRFICCRFRHRP